MIALAAVAARARAIGVEHDDNIAMRTGDRRAFESLPRGYYRCILPGRADHLFADAWAVAVIDEKIALAAGF